MFVTAAIAFTAVSLRPLDAGHLALEGAEGLTACVPGEIDLVEGALGRMAVPVEGDAVADPVVDPEKNLRVVGAGVVEEPPELRTVLPVVPVGPRLEGAGVEKLRVVLGVEIELRAEGDGVALRVDGAGLEKLRVDGAGLEKLRVDGAGLEKLRVVLGVETELRAEGDGVALRADGAGLENDRDVPEGAEKERPALDPPPELNPREAEPPELNPREAEPLLEPNPPLREPLENPPLLREPPENPPLLPREPPPPRVWALSSKP